MKKTFLHLHIEVIEKLNHLRQNEAEPVHSFERFFKNQ